VTKSFKVFPLKNNVWGRQRILYFFLTLAYLKKEQCLGGDRDVNILVLFYFIWQICKANFTHRRNRGANQPSFEDTPLTPAAHDNQNSPCPTFLDPMLVRSVPTDLVPIFLSSIFIVDFLSKVQIRATSTFLGAQRL
jgi:hypothetical protein